MITIAPSSDKHLESILDWLREERSKTGEGFYCNKSIIISSHHNGEVHVALENEFVVGFVGDHLYSYSKGSSIDILEVHPKHRNRNIGKTLALGTISRLFELGAELVSVECAPRSSEGFWRKLGFKLKDDIPDSIEENPILILNKSTEFSPAI